MRYKGVSTYVPKEGTVKIEQPPADLSFLAQRSFDQIPTGDVISAQASLTSSKPTDQDEITWTITPTVGGIRNETPANHKGPLFSFVPDPPAHPAYGSGGSDRRSTALSYRIKAAFGVSEDSRTIVQDERDIIRQEYVNHGIAVPERDEFNAPIATTNFTVAEINNTAYSVIFGQPGQFAQAVRDEYNRQIQTRLGLDHTPNYGLTLTSGWRNPERNEAVGGVINSHHQSGDAIDLTVGTVPRLSREELNCILRSAASTVGEAIAEIPGSNADIRCNHPDIDHIHVER